MEIEYHPGRYDREVSRSLVERGSQVASHVEWTDASDAFHPLTIGLIHLCLNIKAERAELWLTCYLANS